MSIFKIGLQKVSTNQAMVITGKGLGKGPNVFHDEKSGKTIKIVRGGTEWIPPFQMAERISLNSIQIALKTPRIYTADGVPIMVEATATLRIGTPLESIATYAEQFLGKKPKEVEAELKPVLEGNLRAIVAKLDVLSVNNKREKFIEEVTKIAEPELGRMGLEIISIVLDDVRDADENGFLANMGRKIIAETVRDAEKAESDAELEIAKTLASNKQAEEVAKNSAEKAIQESKRELDLARTETEASTKQAKADADQRLQLQQTKLQRDLREQQIQAQKKEQDETLTIKETELEITKKNAQIEAEKAIVAARATADIEVINAEAEAKVKLAHAEAEAGAIEAQGKAKAESIRQLGLAEAEAIQKKAEAMKEYGNAAIAEMMIGILPEMAKAIATPLAAIEQVKVLEMGGNSNGGVQSIAGNTIGIMSMVQESIKETTGIDIKELVNTKAAYGRNHGNAVTDPTLPTVEAEAIEEESVAVFDSEGFDQKELSYNK